MFPSLVTCFILKLCHAHMNCLRNVIKKYTLRKKIYVTRMYSSRMRTDRGSGHLIVGGEGGVSLPVEGGCLPEPPMGRHPPLYHTSLAPANRITERCKNITFPHTSYVVGNNSKRHKEEKMTLMSLCFILMQPTEVEI